MASGANRYKSILAEVARDLEIKVDSELCRHVASLRLLRENAVARACRGERVPVADIVALDAALKAYMPKDEGLKIEIHYAEQAYGVCSITCKHCGCRDRYELEHGQYESRPSGRRATEPAPVAGTPANPANAPTASPAPSLSIAAPVEPAPSNVVQFDYAAQRPPMDGSSYNPFGSEYHKGGY